MLNSVTPRIFSPLPRLQSAPPRFSGGIDNGAQAPKSTGFLEAVQTELVTGLESLLTAIRQGLTPEAIPAMIKQFTQLAAKGASTPLGKVEAKDGQVVITSWADGKPIETKIDEGVRELVCGPATSVQDFLVQAFGKTPKLVICPVGWTIPNPDTLASLNADIKTKFDDAATLLAEQMRTNTGDDFTKKLTKIKKKISGEFYETAFAQWWKPIQENLDTLIQFKGLNKGDIAFLTSASYDGVDKAAMDYAEKNGMKIANVTPFCYAQWMDTSKKYPLLVVNGIKEYADACADGANLLLVTGGREHALKEDVARSLIGQKAAVIAADVMDEVHGLTVPARWNGAIENAARYLIKEVGISTANTELAQNPKLLPGLSQSQMNVVAVLEKLFNRITIGDPASLIG